MGEGKRERDLGFAQYARSLRVRLQVPTVTFLTITGVTPVLPFYVQKTEHYKLARIRSFYP